MSVSGKAKILIVDDRPEKAFAIKSVLSILAEVVIVSSGKEALRTLLNTEYAVVLLDVNMPEMDGFETAQMIRQRKVTSTIPILFVTAMDSTGGEIERGYSLGAVDYLFLPISDSALKSKVKVFVELYNQRQAVQEAIEAVKETNAQLETFCHTVAHDLRAPLRSIQGFATALVEDCGPKLAPSEMDYVDRISKSAQRMDVLIQDLLQYSRINTLDLPFEKIDLEPFVQNLISVLKEDVIDKQCKIELKKPMLPIVGHRETLCLVFNNLLTNACKYVPESVTPHVNIKTEDRGQSVRIWVQDNGIGISKEYHEKIFRIFERLHGSEYAGTGVGLAIVTKSITRMGGRVGVESEPDKGSRFWIELPKALN
ncbi:MAG: Sensory box histidine kinase [Verrucomicrobiales bacterium]|nr:Sensory box histidine kinase [Verrucomicrobiales bacterium]